jgi:hypothetical protein
MAPLPGGRTNFGAIVDNGRIYVMGGEASGSTASCLQYEAAANSWFAINPLVQARQGFVAGLIGGRILVSQGTGASTPIGTMEEYTLPRTVYLVEKL